MTDSNMVYVVVSQVLRKLQKMINCIFFKNQIDMCIYIKNDKLSTDKLNGIVMLSKKFDSE